MAPLKDKLKSKPDDEPDAPADDAQAPDEPTGPPPPPASKATLKLSEHELDVTIEGDERTDDEKRERPLRELDDESLLVLYHACRQEVGAR